MAKKCIICEDPAEYKIKDTLDYYCTECAKDYFSDTSILLKVEEEVKRLKKFLNERINLVKLNEQAELGQEKDEEDLTQLVDDEDKEIGSEEE